MHHWIHMKKTLCIVTFATIICSAADRQGAPGEAALGFYQKFKKAELLGIPDQKTLHKLRPYLSKGLIQQIELAGKVEEQYLAGQKEPEPALSEGWNLFYRNYEGATSVVVNSSSSESNRATVVIQCTYQEDEPCTSSSWLLQVSLVLENGKWEMGNR